MISASDIGKVGLLVIALSVGEAAANTGQDELESVAVSYAGLDLSKPDDAEVLYDRLQQAAAEVCGFHRTTGLSVLIETNMQACYADALSRAVTQIDAPLLKEQHEG